MKKKGSEERENEERKEKRREERWVVYLLFVVERDEIWHMKDLWVLRQKIIREDDIILYYINMIWKTIWYIDMINNGSSRRKRKTVVLVVSSSGSFKFLVTNMGIEYWSKIKIP